MASENTKDIIKKIVESRKSQKMVDDNTVGEKIYFKMSANSADFKLLEFISNFKDVLKMEKVLLEEHIYILSIDGDKVDELNDIAKIFRDYEYEMRKRITKDRSVAERHHLDFSATLGRIGLSDVDESLKFFNEMMDYRQSGFKQVEYYASVSDDILFDETAKMFSSLFSVSYDEAYKMSQSIQKTVDGLFDSFPYTGSFSLSHYDVFSAMDILSTEDKKGENIFSDLMVKEKTLRDFLDSIEKDKNYFYRLFDDDFLLKMVKDAKYSVGINSFKIKDIGNHPTDEQIQEFDNKVLELINNSGLENKDAITGQKVFEFLNYYNIDNYDDNQERGVVRAIADVFIAQRAAQYKQKLITILDEKLNYGRVLDMSVDDVKDLMSLLRYHPSYKNRQESQQVTAAMVKDLRFETGCGMQDSKMVLERFGGDYKFAKTFLNVAGHAIYVKGDRDERDLRVTIEKMGRKPFIDNGFEEKKTTNKVTNK